VWSGAFHSFDEWVPDAIVSRSAQAARSDWLRRLLIPESTPSGRPRAKGELE
jgi:hypothetical protein